MLDLAQIRTDLRRYGFTVESGTLEELRRAAQIQGITLGTLGGSEKTYLKPYEVEVAPPRSLSAEVGLGAQPLHTDGAHLENPPDFVALYSGAPTPTPTVVWAPGMGSSPRWWPEFARFGMFTVRGNRGSFLASAHKPNRSRFDPYCMSPADDYARQTVSFLESARADAFVHEWTENDQLLILDNRRVLHARNEISTDADTRLIERLTFMIEKTE